MARHSSHIDHLIQELGKKDSQEALQELFDLYFQMLFNYCRQFVSSSEETEELVADVFYKLWEKRENLSEIKDLKSYLFTAVKNRALNHLRIKKMEAVSIETPNLHLIDQHRDPETNYLTEELREVIAQAIATLPEKCRKIFLLVREERKSYKEVANTLAISPKTVENQMTIATRKLIKAIMPYLKDPDSQTHPSGADQAKELIFLYFLLELLGESAQTCV